MRSLGAAARWIEDELGPGAPVVRARPLRGGIDARVEELVERILARI